MNKDSIPTTDTQETPQITAALDQREPSVSDTEKAAKKVAAKADDAAFESALNQPTIDMNAPELTWDVFLKITQEPQSLRPYLITPAFAQRVLQERDKRNRKRNKQHVAFLVNEIKTGAWRFTADPARFDTDGWLSDAGHRFEAIVRSGVPLVLMVLTQFDRKSQIVLDCGRQNRTGADALTLEGLCGDEDAKLLSTSIEEIIKWERKKAGGRVNKVTPRMQVKYFAANTADLTRLMGKARELRNAYPPRNAAAAKQEPKMDAGDLLTFIYVAVRAGEPEEVVLDFFNKFLDGGSDEEKGSNYPPYQAYVELSPKEEDETHSKSVKKVYRDSVLSEAYHLYKAKKLRKLETIKSHAALCVWPFDIDKEKLKAAKEAKAEKAKAAARKRSEEAPAEASAEQTGSVAVVAA